MIIDVFPFFNELDLLEIRVNELKGIVDRHILVEANRTYTGKSKPLIYHNWAAANAGGYENVYAYIVSNMPGAIDVSPWDREHHQCESAWAIGMTHAKPDDILIVGDVDEIPSSAVLQGILPAGISEPLRLQTNTYACYLDWLAPDRHTLSSVILTQAQSLKLGSWGAIRKNDSLLKLPFAGWHFTDMGGSERNVAKLTGFSHAPELGPTESVANILSGWETLFERYKREGCIRQVGVDGLPRYVRENLPRMRELGLLQQESGEQ